MKHSLLIIAILCLGSCSSTYYGAMEKFGYHKRDILASRVEKARDSQEDAKDQFVSALDKFKNVVKVDGGELESRYNSLNSEYELSEKKAKLVSDRIDSVEKVATALFREWKNELAEYSNAGLRRSSERQLADTEGRYKKLMLTMEQAESKIEPVLSAFHDQVLYLKHNLNAQAIAALGEESVRIESDVDSLVRDMERSIAEANQFMESLS